MPLLLETAKEEIQSQPKRQILAKAKRHQGRLKLHASIEPDQTINQPLTDFLSWVGSLLPEDKFFLFKSMLRWPLFTNEVTGICFDKLSKIFDGRNPAYNYQFMNSEQRDDWEWYRKDILNEPEIWSTTGWEYFKTEINSILIVDIGSEETGDKYPAPYFYFLKIENVISYHVHPRTGIMEWIIFEDGKDRICVYDDERYRVFKRGNSSILGEIIIDEPHNLGYCPARFFWNDPISINNQDVKASPLTKSLSSLDWYLFFGTSKKNLDLHGAYPIFSGYEIECEYKVENGDHCQGGYLYSKEGFSLFDGKQLARCPQCFSKRMAGVGTYLEVPTPTKDGPDLKDPIKMLSVDASSLKYNVEEVERLELKIITTTCGEENVISNSQAINRDQVKAGYQSQNAVATRLKKNFEDAQKFTDETICRLRYGALFLSAKISMGTDFFDLSAEQLRERYKTAKESGASEYELDAIANQIIETEYRHDQTSLQRMYILSQLEPYRHMTKAELIALHKDGYIDDDSLNIKLNFTNFVNKFERENTNILEFGTNVSFDQKINNILNTFKSYATNTRFKQEQLPGAG